MKTAFINCTLLDGSENMQPQSEMSVIIDGDIIVKTEQNAPIPEDCQIIDLEGGYIMPGLINMHVHLPASGKPKKKPTDSAKLAKLLMSNALTRKLAYDMCARYAKTELLSGVTTIRTVGGVSNFDSSIKDRINEGKLCGPRIIAADMAISVPNGHMAGSVAYAAESIEEAVAYVRKIASQNADFIKLMITGGVLDAKIKGEPGEMKMPVEYIKACSEEAHRLGLKVAAHVESPEGVKAALENGVDYIEHGAKADETITELFKQKKASLICTLSPALPYAKFDRSISRITEMEQFNGNVVLEGVIDCAKKALESGVPVGLGTDTGCPYTTHYDMWRELIYFTEFVGVSNKFALYTATKRNAEIAGLGDVTGFVGEGKCADLLITKHNPIENLQALREPLYVVARGRIIKQPKIKKIAEVEKELDKFL